MRVLGVIPARGGSKGIPRKNIRKANGKPLIAYTLEASQQSTLLTDCVVSSDDQEIISVARDFGGYAPFVRPAKLATDQASSIDVVLHATKFMEQLRKGSYDVIVMLQVTAPLRTGQDIDQAIEMLKTSSTDSIVSVCRVDDPHPGKMLQIENDRLKPLIPGWWKELSRRQDLPPVYFLNGALYCVKRDVLINQKSIWGNSTRPYVMPPERSVNIDSILDFYLFETLLKLDRSEQS